MSNENSRREIGDKMLKEVYAGDVTAPAEGYVFTDIMLEQLFAELWTRDTLSMRDKRLLILGVVADKGDRDAFKIHLKSSLKRNEINPDEARELLLFVAQYAGYSRAAGLISCVEEAIAESGD